jgi:hypothetical protein
MPISLRIQQSQDRINRRSQRADFVIIIVLIVVAVEIEVSPTKLDYIEEIISRINV